MRIKMCKFYSRRESEYVGVNETIGETRIWETQLALPPIHPCSPFGGWSTYNVEQEKEKIVSRLKAVVGAVVISLNFVRA